jgi:predicted dehydrogenase
MTPLRIAILGAARIVKPALLDPAAENTDCEIVAIGASSLARAREFAVTHAIPNAGTYEDVIARNDVDMVYIALPPSAHAHWTLRALAAGKHVFLEKPATTNLEEAHQIVAAARAANLRLIEAFHYRWHPLFVRAVEIVRSGQLGTITHAEAEFSAPIARNDVEFRWRPELGGGALADLGCYPVHWLRHLIGEEPDVTASEQIMTPEGVDQRTWARFAFPSGATGEIITDMDPAHGQRRTIAKVSGTKGSLTLINPIAPQYGHEFILQVDGQETRETFTKRATFAFQFDGVIEAVLNGAPVLCEGDDLIGNAAVMAAIRAKSATEN